MHLAMAKKRSNANLNSHKIYNIIILTKLIFETKTLSQENCDPHSIHF